MFLLMVKSNTEIPVLAEVMMMRIKRTGDQSHIK